MESDININLEDSNSVYDSQVYFDQPTTYAEYVALAKMADVNNFLSEEEWNNRGNLRFIGPAAASGLMSAAGNFILREAPRVAETIINEGPRAGANMVMDSLKGEARKVGKALIIGIGDGISNSGKSRNGSGGGGSSPSGSTSGGGTGYSADLRGTYETVPFKLDLKPGLPASVYADTVNYPTSLASFCHITGFRVTFTTIDSDTKFFFDNVLIPKLQNKAQQSVNFKVDLSLLTSAKMIAYLNSLIEILSIYYFCTSILSYCSIPTNKDRGVWALRSMFTTTDLDYLEQIRDMLPAFPIPPNLNSLIFWLYQTFTDGPNGQNIIKYMPVSFNSVTNADSSATGFTGTSSSVLKNCITNLNTTDNMNIASLLTQIVPSWLQPRVMDASPIPMYSSYFSTLFANSYHTYFNGASQYEGPTASGDSVKLNYVSFDEYLDGLILGLTTINVDTVGKRPGFSITVNTLVTVGANTNFTNRWSYVYKTTANNYIWQPSNYNIESAFGRPDLARGYLGNGYYATLPNSIPVKGADVSIVRESTKAIINWVLSTETIVDRRKVFKIDKSSK